MTLPQTPISEFGALSGKVAQNDLWPALPEVLHEYRHLYRDRRWQCLHGIGQKPLVRDLFASPRCDCRLDIGDRHTVEVDSSIGTGQFSLRSCVCRRREFDRLRVWYGF